LDKDPRLTTDHRHNVFIYKGRTQWKILSRFCEQMAERMGDGSGVSNLLASCYARERRWDSARRAIEKAVQETPKNPLVQAWYAYILRESGDADHASIQLGMANQLNRHEQFNLPILLQARFCQNAKIVDCARDNWQRIYGHNLENLSAIGGLAWVDAEIKSYGEATKLIQNGLKISPDYIPLLELRQRGENEGWYAKN
jgi:tetratricopeptide (TPR) repeat protein